jgi:probable F420-dependent oxidoreductase
MSTPPPTGVTFASLGALGVPAALEVAKEAEELGYSSFWTAEANGTEAFGLLGAVGQATHSIGLGTGVIPLTLRTPPLAAMAAATLQALTPDREILLGIGISSPAVAGQWHGAPYSSERPLAQTREYLTLLRECLSGEAVTFSGDFYQVRKFRLAIRLGERRPKVILAALNHGMLRLGGELADGVLLNYLPAHHVHASVAHVRAGGAAPVYAYVHAGVVPDRSVGIDAARRDLFSYAMAPAYAAMFEAAGYADEIALMRECNATGNRDGAVQAMSDRMVDDINTMGDEHHVFQFVESYRAAGVDVPVLMTLPWGSDRRAITTATIRAAVGAF